MVFSISLKIYTILAKISIIYKTEERMDIIGQIVMLLAGCGVFILGFKLLTVSPVLLL